MDTFPHVELTAAQRTELEHLWFVYGNNGAEHTHGNHKWIQDLLERGEDSRTFFLRQGRIPKWKPISPACLKAVDAILRPKPAPDTRPKFNPTKPIVALYSKRLDGDYDFVAAFDREIVEAIPSNTPLLEELLSSLIRGMEGEECAILEFDEPDCPQVWDGPVSPLPRLYGL